MRWLLTAACVAALGVCAPGCGSDGRKPVFPVSGKVTWAGKPARGATVVFHPVGDNGPDAVRPRGKVKDDGTLEVTTYAAKDGAPAGEYRVTVEWWLSPGGDAAPTNRLPSKLGQPDSSGLTVSVAQGPTTIRDIELKR